MKGMETVRPAEHIAKSGGSAYSMLHTDKLKGEQGAVLTFDYIVTCLMSQIASYGDDLGLFPSRERLHRISARGMGD